MADFVFKTVMYVFAYVLHSWPWPQLHGQLCTTPPIAEKAVNSPDVHELILSPAVSVLRISMPTSWGM